MIRHSVWAAMMLAMVAADASLAAQAPAPGTAHESGAPRVDVHAAREALRAADRAHSDAADAQGAVAGLASALAEDAFFLREGEEVLRGREAIRANLAASRLAGARLSWTTLRADVSADGTHGYTYGGGAYTRADGTTAFSRTISYWRNEGGTWTVAAMLLNLADRPAEPAPDGFFRDGGGAPAAAGPADAEAVMQADRDFAALSQAQNPAIAFRDFMAPDGATLGGPVYGPAANYERQRGGGGTLEWGPVHGGVAGSGDLGWTIGVATATGPDGARRYSKYLSVWRRQPDGSWRYVMDSGNARPAPNGG